MRDRMLAGDRLADDPELIRDSKRARQLTHRINALDPTDLEERNRLLRELLGAFGDEVRSVRLQCDYGYQTTIGAHTFANWGLILLDVARITIGDDVQIGPNVRLLTATHPLEPDPRRDKWETTEPITIGDNV